MLKTQTSKNDKRRINNFINAAKKAAPGASLAIPTPEEVRQGILLNKTKAG